MQDIEQYTMESSGHQCHIFVRGTPRVLLVQPTARHEDKNNGRQHEIGYIAATANTDFAMAMFDTGDWARALMPWPDEAVSRDEQTGLHASATLDYAVGTLLPQLHSRYGLLPCIIGGYSLGGMFALWAARQAACFDGVAAASPSLWIRGWDDYADGHAINVQLAYLSLGNQEEHCRNQRMAHIGRCVRNEHSRLCRQIGADSTTLVWNDGGHFGDEARRTAMAFAWAIEKSIQM